MNYNKYTNEFYLTRHQAAFLGMPIGNAFSGAPFKQKEMPFFIAPAIGAAATAIGAAAAAGTMAAVGTAAMATVSAIGTVAMVAGTAMTVVGAVTGDKDLMKIGGIVGLAGGVGSAVAGLGASAIAGGELALGTAGVESANAAIASGAGSAGLPANLVSAGVTNSELAQGASEFASNNASTATQGLTQSTAGATDIASKSGGLLSAPTTNVPGTITSSPTLGNEALTVSGMQDPSLASVYQKGVLTELGKGATGSIGDTLSSDTLAHLGGSDSGFFSSFADEWNSMKTSDKMMLGGGALSLLKDLGGSPQQQALDWQKEVYNRESRNLNGNIGMTPGSFTPIAQPAAKQPLTQRKGMIA